MLAGRARPDSVCSGRAGVFFAGRAARLAAPDLLSPEAALSYGYRIALLASVKWLSKMPCILGACGRGPLQPGVIRFDGGVTPDVPQSTGGPSRLPLL